MHGSPRRQYFDSGKSKVWSNATTHAQCVLPCVSSNHNNHHTALLGKPTCFKDTITIKQSACAKSSAECVMVKQKVPERLCTQSKISSAVHDDRDISTVVLPHQPANKLWHRSTLPHEVERQKWCCVCLKNRYLCLIASKMLRGDLENKVCHAQKKIF